MGVFVDRLRSGAGWIVVAALAATAPARAQLATTPTDAGNLAAATADDSAPPRAAPPMASPRDPNITADLTDVDLSTGSIAKKTPPRRPETVVEAPRAITRLDSDVGAPEPLVRAPLPP